MDYGTGMFLAGIGWYSGILHVRIKQTDPEKSKRESNFYRHLLYKSGLSADEPPEK